MKELFISSLIDLKKSFRKYLVFELIYLLLTSFIFVPLFSYLFNRLFLFMGSNFYLNQDIFRLALDYRGLAGLLILIVIAALLVFHEICVLIIISHKRYLQKEILISEAIITAIKAMPRILGLGTLYLIPFFIMMIPFVDLPITPILTDRLEIPRFITDRIFDSRLLTAAYVIYLCVAAYIFIRCAFALHFVVIENKSIKKAVSASFKFTGKISLRVFLYLILFNMILLISGFAVISGLAAIPLLSDLDFGYILKNHVITLSGSVSFVYTLLLTPINIVFLTRIYHKFYEDHRSRPDDTSVTYNSRLLQGAELFIRNIFIKRKSIVILVLAVYLGGVLPVNMLVSDSIRNIGRPVLIAGHRGDPVNAPENTLGSIGLAIGYGADFVEIDVQMTKDGVIVLNHDSSLMRMAGVPYSVSELTFDEISAFDIGSRFSNEFEGERIPSLKEVLDEVKGRAKLIIEIKPYGSAERLAKAVCSLINDADMRDDCYIQSFQYDILTEVRKTEPDIKIGQILFFAVGNLDALDVDFYTIEKGLLSNDFVKMARRQNREIWVWTVNREKDITEVLSYDIDGIITDYIKRVQEAVGISR